MPVGLSEAGPTPTGSFMFCCILLIEALPAKTEEAALIKKRGGEKWVKL